MTRISKMQRLTVSATLALGAIFATPAAGEQPQIVYTLLHTFMGFTVPDGANPEGGLIADAQGNIYGTTSAGGASNQGEVFRWDTNNQWMVLYPFTGFADGGMPKAGVVLDSAGNLYGTTFGGGSGHGVVYELSPTPNGPWLERVIHTFTGGVDGGEPYASLILDRSGNLYGTTTTGGILPGGGTGDGVVFELSPNGGGAWTETPLYTFAGKPDGANPYASLVFDGNGDLWGTTSNGGQGSGLGNGVVFELTPPTWGEIVVHRFAGGLGDGENPQAGLTLDSSGNLYGTTPFGGKASGSGYGVVYTIPTGGSETVLYKFQGALDGDCPYAGLIYSSATGLLYGITYVGGASGNGLVFSMTTGGVKTPVFSFPAAPSPEFAFGALVQTPSGIYGTTYGGSGAFYYGVLFNLN